MAVYALFSMAVFWCGTGSAAELPSTGAKALIARYQAIGAKLKVNQFAAPIYLESLETEDSLKADVFGVIGYPFETVSHALQSPLTWCDITSLHTNIKACTAKKAVDRWLMTIYSGRKYYQPPEDAYQLKLTFRTAEQKPDYLDVDLAADEGPLGTKDHRIRLEAAPVDKGRTFIHLSYAYGIGPLAHLAINSYFATIARDKVGFSMVEGKGGTPVYLRGVRGSVERNTLRYYLALQSYLDALKFPEGERFEQRIHRWYALTARYPQQLKEVERPEYLSSKRREQNNMLLLQKQIGG